MQRSAWNLIQRGRRTAAGSCAPRAAASGEQPPGSTAAPAPCHGRAAHQHRAAHRHRAAEREQHRQHPGAPGAAPCRCEPPPGAASHRGAPRARRGDKQPGALSAIFSSVKTSGGQKRRPWVKPAVGRTCLAEFPTLRPPPGSPKPPRPAAARGAPQARREPRSLPCGTPGARHRAGGPRCLLTPPAVGQGPPRTPPRHRAGPRLLRARAPSAVSRRHLHGPSAKNRCKAKHLFVITAQP